MIWGLEGVRRNSPRAYMAAVVFACFALLLRLLMAAVEWNSAPYLPFFFATVATAAIGGFWPGVVTAILGTLLARLSNPEGGWAHLIDPSDEFAPVRYLLSAIFVSYVCEKLIQSRQRVRDSEKALQLQAEELKRSNRELEQFAFVASHDMQEPLRTIKLHTDLLLRNIQKGEYSDLTQSAAFVGESVQRMERQIHDLLSYSRVLQAQAEPTVVNTPAAVQQAIRASQALIDECGAEIRIAELPPVLAQDTPVIQLFQNLVTNAIKYRNPEIQAKISINAEVRGRIVQFSVEDNGIGFDSKYGDTVFRLFTRLNGSKYPGTGLGLAICKRVVEQYGGRIWVESQPGIGSKFLFTLPSAAPTRAGGR